MKDIDAPTDPTLLTWRYVRVALVALVLLIFASVGIEFTKVGHFLTSISDYYYTPVRSCFVGALLGVAACMICLRGSTTAEDTLLNLAGMLAPVVAFVPTPNSPVCTPAPGEPCAYDISNNILALVIVTLLVLAFALALVRHSREGHKPSAAAIRSLALAVALCTLGLLAFLLARTQLERYGHYTAAVAMFACIFLVALSNAGGYRDHKQTREEAATRIAWMVKNPYSWIAAVMVIASLAILFAWLATDSPYMILAIEAVLIGVFGVFWAIQTRDLWDDGLRPVSPSARFLPAVTRRTGLLVGRTHART